MTEVSVPCGACADKLRPGDGFCPGCGRAASDEDRAALERRLESTDYQAYERGKTVRTAATWIGVLALVFLVSGAVMFLIQRSNAQDAIGNLTRFADEETLQPIDGKTYTAGELRAQLGREPYQLLLMNVILAALLGGLWLWGRRAPLPAIICAVALVVVVWVGNAIIDPTTLLQGVLLKIVALVVLSKGLSAALHARAILRHPA